MRININRFIKLLSIFLLINLYNVLDVKSSESGIEDGECIKADINLIQELNNSLVERKVYRKGDKITFTLYNGLIDELLNSNTYEDDKLINNLSGKIIQTTIDSSGYAYLPKSDPIYLDGLSSEQVKEKISIELKKRYKDPYISIESNEPSNVRVSIAGEVLNPGDYIISSLQGEDLVLQNQPSRTIKKLFVKSGGILNSADYENIIIYRDDKCYLINALNLIGRSRVDFILRQDDKIEVKSFNKLRNYSEDYIKLGKSQLSTKNQIVYLYGLVNNAGPIEVDWFNNPTISVAMAGGIQKGGAYNVLIAYKNNADQSYKIKKTRVALKNSSFINNSNMPLTHKSVIVVSRSSYSRIIEFLKDVTFPIVTYRSLENSL